MQQYYFYFDRILLPVTPAAMKISVGNLNETVDLANGGQFNIINPPALTKISFDLLLPNEKHPFAQYAGGFQGAGYYLELLERLKSDGRPFEFLVIRTLTKDTALQFAARLLPYSPEMAQAATGRSDGKIYAADADILQFEMDSGLTRYIADTRLFVTLETYSVSEDAEKYGRDSFVSLELKQYREYGIKTVAFQRQ